MLYIRHIQATYNEIMSLLDEEIEFVRKRLPLCLCIDLSDSMSATGDDGVTKIRELNEGLEEFYNIIRNDDFMPYDIETAVVTFGKDVKAVQEFLPVRLQKSLALEESGFTPFATAFTTAYDLIRKRIRKFQEYCTYYGKPWIITITDGSFVGNSKEELDKAESWLKDFVCNKDFYYANA